MKSINQIHGNYLSEPDRVLLKISSLDDNEYVFLLTRRITCLLAELFQRYTVHEMHPHDIKFSGPDIQNLKDEISAKKTDLNQKYTGGKTHPLGKMPHLISAIKLTQHKKDLKVLKFSLKGHQSVSFYVNLKLMRIMLQFFNKIQTIAQWNIDIGEKEPYLDEALEITLNKITLH